MENADRQKKVLPAPLLVLVCLLLSLAAQLLHPVRLLPDFGIAGVLAGIVVCMASLAVGLSGVREFKRHNTPTNPFQPITALVTSGVFRYTRNPMYLGFVALFLGIAIAVNSLAFLIAAVLLAALL